MVAGVNVLTTLVFVNFLGLCFWYSGCGCGEDSQQEQGVLGFWAMYSNQICFTLTLAREVWKRLSFPIIVAVIPARYRLHEKSPVILSVTTVIAQDSQANSKK